MERDLIQKVFLIDFNNNSYNKFNTNLI